eukprot:CAMPEP_0194200560 /NCGR_PEP_ID=MMETSP0156-20130528/1112_1 /TAXON_ID=33649 /ORGANISM="Thalassionema nitzschioides, Strain L26-B" /LENGTH=76 /DNA_ID=CAMNT_0038925569 /DNA_START=43 /DNA_END=273 /DNA_ORIENTATION=+
MVILETAAISAAAYGAYRGGKKAVDSGKKSLFKRRQKKEKEDQRASAEREREEERVATEKLSIKERLEMYKSGRGF